MIVAAIFYPKTETSRFDEKYYHTTHMKMVHELLTPMGLCGARALYGQPGQDGTPPLYAVVTLLDFEDITAFADAGLETMCVGGGQGMAAIFERA